MSLFIIVIEAVSREIRSICPEELLYNCFILVIWHSLVSDLRA